MSERKIDDILEDMEDLLDAAWQMPLSGGKAVINVEKMRDLIDKVRGNLPSEIRQANAIVNDRLTILADAKKEAERVISNAEERRTQMLSREQVVIDAQEKATEIQNQTQKRAREMRKTAQDYTEDLLKKTEDVLMQQVNQVRQARASVRNGNKQGEQ